jgi:hypothetical protein
MLCIMDSHINRPKSLFFGARHFQRLSKLDYALLSAMLVVSIPVGHWVMPWLVPGSPSDWAMVLVTALVSVLLTAYSWQLPGMSRLPGMLGMTVACIGIYLFAWPEHLQDNVFCAICAINLGVWSYIRYAIQHSSADKASAA